MRKAIIIGAGPAGLTAAYELLNKTDIIPIIIEQDGQVGGLSKTIDFEGNKIDIGGHRFFSKSKKVVDWWLKILPLQSGGDENIRLQYQNQSSEYVVTSGDEPGNDEDVMLLRPRKSRIYYKGLFFDYPLQFNISTLRKLGLVNVLKFACSYAKAKLFPVKPELSLEDFFKNRFGSVLYKTFFKEYTEKVWGVPCSKLPASWGRQRIKGLNVMQVLKHAVRSLFYKSSDIHQKNTNTSLIEQFLYPKYGPGQMWQKVADHIVEGGGSIFLNTAVTGIHGDGANRILSATIKENNSGNEQLIEADYFFSTMPVRELLRNLGGFKIPANVLAASDSLEYRDFLIVGILTNKELAQKNISDNWIYIQDTGIKAGRLQFFHNWSPGMIKEPGNKWIGVEYFCNESDSFWQQDDEAIAAFAVSEMAKIGMIDASAVKNTCVVKVKKAYPSYFGGYSNFEIVKQYLDAIENLFPIGRNGMHRYNNTDHSMLTAMAAVDNIISGQTDKSNIWEINTDDEYHEEAK